MIKVSNTFIQVVVDVVGGGTDQLDPLVIGLVVRPRPLEARQQRMVDIDGSPAQPLAHLARQDLHVAGEDHQLGAGLLNHLPHLRLLLGLGFRRDGEVVVGNAVPGRQALQVRMVGDDRPDLDGQLADAVAVEQVVEAVIGLGDHDHHRHARARGGQLEAHAELGGPLGEAGLEVCRIEARLLGTELRADEEVPAQAIVEGVLLGDVAAALLEEACHHIHRAQPARTLSRQNPVAFLGAHHPLSSVYRAEGSARRDNGR